MLYIVATPIGNLEDITFRAIKTLREVDFIIAENPRKSTLLLKHHEIDKPLVAFHAQSSSSSAEKLIKRVTQEGAAAYIAEAGTPCVSDPGYHLLQEALKNDVPIIPIPGASALTTILSVAGIPTHDFLFHGFLPHKKGRQTIFTSLAQSERTHIFYESVHRFPKLLQQLDEHLEDDRIMVVGRELTKLHEDIFRGTLAQAQQYFTPHNTKGEFVVLIAPKGYTLS